MPVTALLTFSLAESPIPAETRKARKKMTAFSRSRPCWGYSHRSESVKASMVTTSDTCAAGAHVRNMDISSQEVERAKVRQERTHKPMIRPSLRHQVRAWGVI